MQAVDGARVPVCLAGDGGSLHETALLSVVACIVFLAGRYARDEQVTLDLMARARAALRPMRHATQADRDIRFTVDISGMPSLATLSARVLAAVGEADAEQVAEQVAEQPAEQDADTSPTVLRGLLIDMGAATPEAPLSADLCVRVIVDGEHVELALEHDASLFDRPTIEHFRDALGTLLAAVARDADRALERIPLVDDVERATIGEGSVTSASTGVDRSMVARIAQQIARTPDAIAVEQADRTLTYHELGRRAASLAATLRSHGVGPGSVVGVCVDRSFEMLIALVAVQAAGGAFLPIDADLPHDRVAFKLRDAACTIVLTQRRLLALMQGFGNALTVVDVDAVPLQPTAQLDEADTSGYDPQQLAYVMYTSGSTGQPKGVAIPQRAVSNHAQWFADFVELSAADRVLQVSSISFDASLAELFAPLMVGATIVLAPRHAQRDLLGLPSFAAEARITLMQQVPSALRVMIRSPAFASLTHLRYLVSGGESLDGDLARAILRLLPQVRLGNCYGPTEATVDALAFEVPRDLESVTTVPIGRPIANARCRILDERGAPVPMGMPGELYVGGLGLAHGYLNMPERTAARFVPDPWLPGERLYRTGDVARWRADGTVECLGRLDTQIKLRGYRIEPGEIEAVLLGHPGVRQAAVVLREDGPGGSHLAAYVVCARDTAVTSAALLETLRASCPVWMIPSALCFLDAMPVMPSGKLDRAALPAPDASAFERERQIQDAQVDDPLERSLQTLWESVLAVHPIGRDDDFFALGGHSLSAIRLLSEIERVHGVALRAATLFEAPTIRALAARMAASSLASPISTVVRVQPEGSRTPLFLAPGGGGELFIFEALARALGADQPLYILDMYVFDEIVLPTAEVTLADVAARMLVDIRREQPHGPYQLAGYSLGGNIAVEIAQQLRAAGEQVHLLALLDCDGPDYPVLQPLVPRMLTHLRHALSLSAPEALGYMGNRVRNAMRRVLPPPAPSLYSDQPGIELVPAQVIEALERALQPVLLAWERYRPQPYDGRTLIVRADIRRPMIGVQDDDPWLGWKPFLHGEVLLDRLPTDHFSMFHTVNAPQFVAMIEGYLREGPIVGR